MTECWVEEHLYCPACGSPLKRFGGGKPVADLYCSRCGEEFELKSKCGQFGSVITDGAYSTMMKRLAEANNPSLFLLAYDVGMTVQHFTAVPKHFFITSIIEKRRPLAQTARRAGWIGCNIRLSGIPAVGKIPLVHQGVAIPRRSVLQTWDKTAFIARKDLSHRAWLVETMECIEQIPSTVFTLKDVYAFEQSLAEKHPSNNNVKPKLRQQLQVLRDRGIIEFLGAGKYRKLVKEDSI